MASRDDIIAWCDHYLNAAAWQDAAVNGLQVEGSPEIHRLATAVSASEQTIRQAAAWRADGLLVHHGLLYGSRMEPLTGLFAGRLRPLFQNNINLIGYHLPLDGHPAIGNCAALAYATGFEPVDRFAMIGGGLLGVVGESREPISLDDLARRLTLATERGPVVFRADLDDLVWQAGFLTGSGYSTLSDAKRAGCQVLVTGDVREPTMAEARELGIHLIAAGHEATERNGVQSLAALLEDEFNIETVFIHDPNPI